MQYHDVHIHFFHDGPIDSFLSDFHHMQGFGGGCLLMFEETPKRLSDALPMAPKAYHHLITEDTIHSSDNAVEVLRNHSEPRFIPYVDTRYFNHGHVRALSRYVEKGYQGVKILFVPEPDESIGIAGWEYSLGRSVRASEQVTADLMDECERFRLPVLFHADLRRYGDFTAEMLSAHPHLRVNIPHFGGSRKKMAHFLNEYEHCYTDFSSLLPHMMKDPEAYRSFISSFPDRILFGSDALFGDPTVVKEYIEFADSFLDEELRDKVGRENYLRFHNPR